MGGTVQLRLRAAVATARAEACCSRAQPRTLKGHPAGAAASSSLQPSTREGPWANSGCPLSMPGLVVQR